MPARASPTHVRYYHSVVISLAADGLILFYFQSHLRAKHQLRKLYFCVLASRLAQTAKLLVACVMLLSFALVYYVPVDVVWRRIQDRVPARNQRWAVAGLRLAGTLIIGKAYLYPIEISSSYLGFLKYVGIHYYYNRDIKCFRFKT